MRILGWANDNLDWIARMFSHNISALRLQVLMLKVIGNHRMRGEMITAVQGELNRLEASLADLENKFIQTLESETEMLLEGMTELTANTAQIARTCPKDSGFQAASRLVHNSKTKLTANLGQFELQAEAKIDKQFKAMKKAISDLREQLTSS